MYVERDEGRSAEILEELKVDAMVRELHKGG
jgi:hypothetical protein